MRDGKVSQKWKASLSVEQKEIWIVSVFKLGTFVLLLPSYGNDSNINFTFYFLLDKKDSKEKFLVDKVGLKRISLI